MSDIRGTIEADELIVGEGVVVSAGVHIRGQYPGERAKRVVLGDHCYIGEDTKIFCPEFRLGDYSTWYERGLANGPKALQIGRNCWIGRDVNLNPQGGLTLDDGVGVGEKSLLWTHIAFGDVTQGCRFDGVKPMFVGHDAWFVGRCDVSPVRVEPMAMALTGSVITRDMLANHVYGGNPARDLTAKVGPQFRPLTLSEKRLALWQLILDFVAEHPEARESFTVAESREHFDELRGLLRGGEEVTVFDVERREYLKCGGGAEVAFLKRHTPRVKFTPYGAPAFVDRPLYSANSQAEDETQPVEALGGAR